MRNRRGNLSSPAHFCGRRNSAAAQTLVRDVVARKKRRWGKSGNKHFLLLENNLEWKMLRQSDLTRRLRNGGIDSIWSSGSFDAARLCAQLRANVRKVRFGEDKTQLQQILAFLPASLSLSLSPFSPPLSLNRLRVCVCAAKTNLSAASDADVEIKHWSPAQGERLSAFHVLIRDKIPYLGLLGPA